MKIKVSLVIIFSALLSVTSAILANDKQKEFVKGFVSGTYHLIGKSLGSDKTYYGKVKLEATDQDIMVHREISGTKVSGTASIDTVLSDKVSVLRIRFKENKIQFEETCMIGADLDNFARITCYLYQPGIITDNPGFEALFIEHSTD